MIPDLAYIDFCRKINEGDLENIETIGMIRGLHSAVPFVFLRSVYIIGQFIHIQETGSELQIIFFFPACSILAGVQTHTEIEIALPDLSFEGIDLQEIIGADLYVPADAVQL